MTKEIITKELRTMIENEVLYRYDSLDKAQDSANTLIDTIERAFSQQRKEIIEKIEDWDLGAMPRTDEFAKGWNGCRQHFGEGKKKLLEDLKNLIKEDVKEKEYPIKIAGMILGRKYHCIICGKEVKGFKDRLSAQEFRISRMCQECQDKTFK